MNPSFAIRDKTSSSSVTAAQYRNSARIWRHEADRSRRMGWHRQAPIDDALADCYEQLARMVELGESRKAAGF